jgi:glucose/arabinose dehydrogenase
VSATILNSRKRIIGAVALIAVLLAGAIAFVATRKDSNQDFTAHPDNDPPVGAGKGTPDDPKRTGQLRDVKLKLTPVATLEQPTQLQARSATEDLYVTERAGRVRRLERKTDGTFKLDPKPVLDVSSKVTTDGEMGLLGLAFSGDGGRLYVDYNTADRTTHLVAYDLGPDNTAINPVELLSVPQPFTNHKGGNLHLGPDGYLYFGLGDGGSQNDPDERAADLDDLHGKILRIDPSKPSDAQPYSIPADNPYATGGGKPEIYLHGVRNPWRFSFDSKTKDLWIGDVGQNNVEEVDRLTAEEDFGRGRDLGWSGLEGTRRNIEDRIRPGTVPPVFEYTHDDGRCSITGGVVYRGKAIPDLDGTYLFTDLCATTLRGLQVADDGKVTDERGLGVDMDQVISIDQDADGEVYLLSAQGQIMKLGPA